MKNKKAAEMTIGTIIIIILALVVLAVVIYGFTTGWGNLWQNIINFGGGNINVASVAKACQVACVSLSEYDYCTLTRKVTFNDKGIADSNNGRSFTCKELETKGAGISCDSLPCPGTVAAGEKTCTNQFGRWQTNPCGSQEDITTTLTNTNDKGSNVYCCRTKCNTLGGTWSPTACNPSNQVDITADVSDKSDQYANTHCCKSK